ncbi:MAG: hypothetical protein WCL00_14515, partial [Bacteroidota bacterium]
FLIGGSRLTFLSLVPFIKRVQDNEIQACLGGIKYLEIMDQFLDGDITEGNKLILDKIRPPLALISLSVAVKRLSSEVLPAGIFNNIVTNVVKAKTPTSKVDRNEVAISLEKDGKNELFKLQEYLRKLASGTSGETFTTVDPSEHIDPEQKFVRL